MNILVILPRFPYPLFKGDKLRAFHQIRMMSRNNNVYLICLNEEAVATEGLKLLQPYCTKIKTIRNTKLHSLLQLTKGLFSSKPFQAHFFANSRLKKTVFEWCGKYNIDVLFAQMIRMGENIPENIKAHKHLDFQDALSFNMKRRYHHSGKYYKKLVKEEQKRLEVYEREITHKFDTFSAISKPDIRILEKITGKEIFLLPNGVNEEFFDFPLNEEKKYDLIFTGNMGYHPNITACKYLVNELLPILSTEYRPLKICLAGTNPAPEIQAMQSDLVTVTGRVPDLRPYLANARLFIAPLFSGSGLQNKLLESMAMGLPSITTHLANNALKAKPGKDIIVCNDRQAFTRQLIWLLENEKEAREIGINGRNFIKEKYRWETFDDQFNEFISSFL